MDYEAGQHLWGYLATFIFAPLAVAAAYKPEWWVLWLAVFLLGSCYCITFYSLGYQAGSRRQLQINLTRNQTLVTPIVPPGDHSGFAGRRRPL